ncbi:MAG: LLM class flavin-dependent oxidoreductase [Acinetobacter populi]|jgi:alkanesulfonate monooxygenase|uniref:LLM class flavin-dependent oxidoreductase n=1 Tax=Acinetobacter populi TaxID=1582270 RepID=UPI0023571A84|nr:LLM class flavin-dependent oxidoreductase [Acinetobacter populi]MCH4249100.1 LLM class flavin-dependent oxidoreductase [Acinetobacter populi]
MTDSKRQIKLGAFLQSVGHHLAAWRHPDVNPKNATRLEHLKHLAQIAERGKFDAIFFADGLGWPQIDPQLLAKGAPTYFWEPLTVLSAIAQVTKNIGLISTISTSYLPPFHLARLFASLDHLSGGRAGWNLVTSGTDFEANNFNLETQTSHLERYQKAREYVDVVKGLWDSLDDDAYLFDQDSGNFFEPEKLHYLNHRGQYFSVAGPLQSARPVQGYPVIVQAGSSEDGKNLAAQTAEIVFTAQQTFEGAKAFYQDIKQRVAKAGRDPDAVKVMPGIMPVIAETRELAQQKFDYLQSLIDPEIGISLLSAFIGNIDLSQYSIDDPVPDFPTTEGWQSRQQLILEVAKRENLTIRQLYQKVAGARGHRILIGTAEDIADELQYLFEQGAADGFNILPPTFPQDLTIFVDQVVPILQQRGLYRTEYEGHTLREHLGLVRPRSRYHASA